MAKTMRNVLVTGASRGLGLGIARKLAGAGYGVIALARQKTKQVTEAAAEAKREKHGALHFVSFDLGKVDEISDLVKVLRKFQGDIGVLQRAAADIVRPFRDEPGFEVFARWFRAGRSMLPKEDRRHFQFRQLAQI